MSHRRHLYVVAEYADPLDLVKTEIDVVTNRMRKMVLCSDVFNNYAQHDGVSSIIGNQILNTLVYYFYITHYHNHLLK